MRSLTQIAVPFHNAELYVVEHKGQPYNLMQTIVEGMGLDWKRQFVKLKQCFAQGIVEITIPTICHLHLMAVLENHKYHLFQTILGYWIAKILQESLVIHLDLRKSFYLKLFKQQLNA